MKDHDRMTSLIIGSPIGNSPVDEPVRHLYFTDRGIIIETHKTKRCFWDRTPINTCTGKRAVSLPEVAWKMPLF